jgi:hydroxymethylpyrimidine/phosphomethylpyrimidine kinase
MFDKDSYTPLIKKKIAVSTLEQLKFMYEILLINNTSNHFNKSIIDDVKRLIKYRTAELVYSNIPELEVLTTLKPTANRLDLEKQYTLIKNAHSALRAKKVDLKKEKELAQMFAIEQFKELFDS